MTDIGNNLTTERTSGANMRRFGAGLVAVIALIGLTSVVHAFELHVPCTSSHDCPRGAFCRHTSNFRGQCITLPQTPFGIFGRRQNDFPPESDPIEQAPGSEPLLRCSDKDPCPAGFICRTNGDSKLANGRCVSDALPCWSTTDCSTGDFCDKEDEEFSLAGWCRSREERESNTDAQ